MFSPVVELDAGAGNQVLDGAGDQDLVWSREGDYASGDVDRETTQVIASDVTLARM